MTVAELIAELTRLTEGAPALANAKVRITVVREGVSRQTRHHALARLVRTDSVLDTTYVSIASGESRDWS